MTNISDRINTFLEGWGVKAVDIIVPLAILFFGWIAAVLVSRGVRKLLDRTNMDERLATLVLGETKGPTIDSGEWVSRVVYWLLMLFVLATFLVRLQLAVAAGPISALLESVFAFVPRVVGAGLLVLVAWMVARIVRRIVRGTLTRTRVDTAAAETTKSTEIRPSQAVAEAAYWLVYLLFLPAILGVLELQGILRPVEGMLAKLLGFLPNLLSAAVIFIAGWFIAKLVQRIVTSVLVAAGLDALSEKHGISKALGDKRLSEIIGLVVNILIIIPVAVAALGALKLDAVTRPASQMLTTLFDALPNIFGAALVLAVSYFIGKLVAGLITNILGSAGFDRILIRLGISKTEPLPGELTPSRFAGILVMTAIMLFAVTEAAALLGFDRLSFLIADFIELAGHVALGLVILGLGLFLGDLAAKGIRASNAKQSGLLASAARISIVVLAAAMGLRQMGIANEIIIVAFGLSLGSVAVAVALAFGLGAREEAADVVKQWRARWRDEK